MEKENEGVEGAEDKEENKILEEELEEEKELEEVEEEKEEEREEKEVLDKEAEEILEEAKDEMERWVPKTKLGKMVKEGKITDIKQIFEKGLKIKEPEIVDFLIPNLKQELILIGGTSGKGGGIQRRPVRRTVRVHASGKRMSFSILSVIGNENGYIGIGFGKSDDTKKALAQAINKAKKNIFPIVRGCGSWYCACKRPHSIPFSVRGKKGSVRVILLPAPRGLGLCAQDEIKKILRLAGIKDIRMNSFGNTGARINFVYAVEDALKNLIRLKIKPEDYENKGIVVGAIE